MQLVLKGEKQERLLENLLLFEDIRAKEVKWIGGIN